MRHAPRQYRVNFRANRERGAIFILVLAIALGLVATTLYFANSMIMEYRGAENEVAGWAAGQAEEGARRYLLSMLKQQAEKGRMPESWEYQAEAVAVGDDGAKFWLIGRDPNATAPTDRPVFGLIDEASKLNINAMRRPLLEEMPGITPELAAAILDWRDTNEDVRDGGAESTSYLLSTPSYRAKNGLYESPEELRLVRGMDWLLLYREDANRNGTLDENENDAAATPPEDNADGRLDPGILEYVTVWSRQPNTRADGSPRINVANTRRENEQALRQLLDANLGEERRRALVQAMDRLTSPRQSVLQFYVRSGMAAEEFALIENDLTHRNGDFVRGLINVNTAPAAVLACIPGIGIENAPALVAYRQGKTGESLKSIAWVKEALPATSVRAAGRWLTTRSYQFAADVVAIGPKGRGLRRDLFIIDTAQGDPRIVYRRDLSRLGWPLGASIREELRYAKQY